MHFWNTFAVLNFLMHLAYNMKPGEMILNIFTSGSHCLSLSILVVISLEIFSYRHLWNS